MSTTLWRVAGVADDLEVLGRGRDDTPCVRHWFEDDAGHRRWIFTDDDILELLRREPVGLIPVAEAIAVVRWGEYFEEARRGWLEWGFALSRTAGCHGSHGGTVVGLVAADELVLVRMARLLEILARELDRRLHGLRAAAEGFYVVEVIGRDTAEFFDEVEGHVGRAVHGRRKGELVPLGPHGLCDARMTVAEQG